MGIDDSVEINPTDILLEWNKSTVRNIGPGEDIRHYYNSLPLISRSDLDLVDKGPEVYKLVKSKEWKEPESGSLYLGTAVHSKLLEPHLFVEDYYIADQEKPTNITATYVEFVQQYALSLDEIPTGFDISENWESLLEGAYELYTTTVEKTRYEKQKTFEEKVNPYKTYLISWANNLGKKSLTEKDYSTIDYIEKSVKSHWKARQLIFPNEYFPYNKIKPDVLTEELIIWKPPHTTATRLAKSLLDRVILDHDNSTAYLVDLKTTSSRIGNSQETIDVINKWNYNRQIAFYYDALDYYLAEKGFKYTIECYIVMVETIAPNRARVIHLPYIQLYTARKRYQELFKRLEWHLDNNVWIPKEQQEYLDIITYIDE